MLMNNLSFNRIPINKPSITKEEESYVMDSIINGWGENCYQYIYKFEEEFARYNNVKHAIATSSCTGAIHLALLALGVTVGDEVIVPEISWIATVEPVLYCNAKPVFADVSKHNWCIDPVSIRNKITSKTKAIIVVHLYGNMTEMDEIMKISSEFGIPIVEDAAEALGSTFDGKKAGSIGTFGLFSFHGTKTMTTGEGGCVITNDNTLAHKIRVLNDHGRNSKDPEHKMFWMRDYGYKYKMSNLQAALGFSQIKRISELVVKKREIFHYYHQHLNQLKIQMNVEQSNVYNSYWLPTIVFQYEGFQRDEFFKECYTKNIDSRPFFYPLSSLPMFKSRKENINAYDLYSKGINLPSFHDITFNELDRVIELILNFVNRYE